MLWQFQEASFLDNIERFIVGENIMTYVYFDSGVTFYLDHNNGESKKNCWTCGKPRRIPSNDQHTLFPFLDEKLNFIFFMDPYHL